jgi:hypothetical protein
MTLKGMGFLSAGLCFAVLLSAGLAAAAGAVDLSTINANSQAYSAPQNAQERADLLKVLKSLDDDGNQSVQNGTSTYGMLQNPYSFEDPQAELEQKNTAKALQKYNSIYYGSDNPDNWYYWTNQWLNDEDGHNSVYSSQDNPYSFSDPQSNLEQKNTAKALQKYNNAYYGSSNPDNWYYWTNQWLNE